MVDSARAIPPGVGAALESVSGQEAVSVQEAESWEEKKSREYKCTVKIEHLVSFVKNTGLDTQPWPRPLNPSHAQSQRMANSKQAPIKHTAPWS